MKNFNKVSTVILTIALILGIIGPSTTIAATDPGLGAAATFSIIAQTAITGTGTISGDVGINSTGAGITALTAGNVGGIISSTDGVAPGLAILVPAVQANLLTANGDISGQGATASIGPVLDGLVLTTGVYDIGAGRLNGGVLTLDGPGIYIFRASSDFVSSGSINLTNGARACDVYWQVNTLATINGSSFVGTIIAGTGIHFGANVTLDGRALALGGDVTLLSNTISGPTCATPPPPPPPVVPPVVVPPVAVIPPLVFVGAASVGGPSGGATGAGMIGGPIVFSTNQGPVTVVATVTPLIPTPTTVVLPLLAQVSVAPTPIVLGASEVKFPNTGISPFESNKNLAIMAFGLVMAIMLAIVSRKKYLVL